MYVNLCTCMHYKNRHSRIVSAHAWLRVEVHFARVTREWRATERRTVADCVCCRVRVWERLPIPSWRTFSVHCSIPKTNKKVNTLVQKAYQYTCNTVLALYSASVSRKSLLLSFVCVVLKCLAFSAAQFKTWRRKGTRPSPFKMRTRRSTWTMMRR